MRVMVFSKDTEDGAKAMAPTPEALAAFAAMDQFIEELVKAGVFVAGAGLMSTAKSKRVAFDGRGGAVVIDGPFTETKEVVVGFSIWEVKDMDEALAWARRCPTFRPGEIEIRPFMEAADLAEFLTPEDLAAARDGDRGKLGVA
ncbi:MAG: YciI family protein [Hyphomonadaceae bacterium]